MVWNVSKEDNGARFSSLLNFRKGLRKRFEPRQAKILLILRRHVNIHKDQAVMVGPLCECIVQQLSDSKLNGFRVLSCAGGTKKPAPVTRFGLDGE